MIKFVTALDVTTRESWPDTMHNVLVTGGSRGIALRSARRLAGAGL